MIIPSIDILGGKVVQMVQGKKKVIEIAEAPAEFAGRFSDFREVQVIDLDAAMGKGSNRKIIREICGIVNARVGGGIRSISDALFYINAGAKKIIIGTNANKEFLSRLNKVVACEMVAVALDSAGGKILVEGWRNGKWGSVPEKMAELEKYCSEFFCTNVALEGTLQGADIEMARRLKAATKNRLVFAGGISNVDEIGVLEREGIDCVLGMMLYTGRITPGEALIDFAKGNGLVPAIVQDCKSGEVLMLAYMNRISLRETIKSGFATYWSRSRGKLWKKGETSGCLQEVIETRFDCDADAVLLKVRQQGRGACHTGARSCFYRKINEEGWK
ncbi:phosphoribosyl-AMP cyclohydrolase [Candidatus Micrarchaeota archaeon]|nr:phosphoribosyl-AMP cyclohydrolase [Candidatus Micrarchaeota archaeon]